MRRTTRDLGAGAVTPPRHLAVTMWLGCLVFIASQPGLLSQLSVYEGTKPTLVGGSLQLLRSSLESIFKVAVAMLASLVVASVLLAVSGKAGRLSWVLRRLVAALASAPVMMILPLWLVALGNSDASGLGFVVYCMSVMLSCTVLSDPSGATLYRRVSESFSTSALWQWLVTVEIVVAAMQQSLFQTLLLGLPLSLAAELITNRSGLGHVAMMAFSNGNFAQLSLLAAAYVVGFGVLWITWAATVNLALRFDWDRGVERWK